MSDDLHAEAYRELQREYLAELPTAIADLRKNIEAFRRGEDVVAVPGDRMPTRTGLAAIYRH